MSRFIRTFLATGILFGLCMLPVNSMWFKNGVTVSVLQGIGFGLLMTLFMMTFVKSKRVKKSATPSFEAGELVIHEGPANHFKGWEGVGGRLYLTNRRLVFKSHAYNFQNHTLSLALADIQEASPVLTIGLVPNGLQVQTQDGRSEKFVVEDRDGWSNRIRSARQPAP